MFALAEEAIESVLPARARRPGVGTATGLVLVGVVAVLGLTLLVQAVV
jgi:hypothetical protein